MKWTACVLLFLVLLPSGVVAQDSIDFSGRYRLLSIKSDNSPKTVPAWTLTIVHREGTIERTDVMDGKTRISRYTLDGKECKNVTSGGAPSTDEAQLKGKNIVIRSIVRLNTPPSTASSVITTEKWELSRDSTKLIIHSKVEFPGMAVLDSSSTEVYSREP